MYAAAMLLLCCCYAADSADAMYAADAMLHCDCDAMYVTQWCYIATGSATGFRIS